MNKRRHPAVPRHHTFLLAVLLGLGGAVMAAYMPVVSGDGVRSDYLSDAPTRAPPRVHAEMTR